MPAFIFLGAPDVTETVAYGFRFVVGVPVEVTGEPATTKIRGNRFFEEVEAGIPPFFQPGDTLHRSMVVRQVDDVPEPKKRGRPRKASV